MKSIWNGESINGWWRSLAAIIAIAAVVSLPFTLLDDINELGIFKFAFGFICWLYVVAVFTMVAVRGRTPRGFLPWS